MKKITLLLFVAILIAACQPAATPQPTSIPPTKPPAPAPTSAPVEALAGSVNDLIGVWWFPKAGVKVELKTDGTYRTFSSSETIDEGIFTFDSGKATWATSTLYCIDHPTATYEVYVTTLDGNPVSIRMLVVDEDLCQGRADTLKEVGKFQSP